MSHVRNVKRLLITQSVNEQWRMQPIPLADRAKKFITVNSVGITRRRITKLQSLLPVPARLEEAQARLVAEVRPVVEVGVEVARAGVEPVVVGELKIKKLSQARGLSDFFFVWTQSIYC